MWRQICPKVVHVSDIIQAKLDKMPVFLAPMAGISDVPFRNLVLRFGAGLVVSEMVASNEFMTNRPSARMRADLGLDEDRTSVQIAGRDADLMAECARMVADGGARIIDINMGCPAKKVTNGASGSALMKEPDLALRLIAAVVGAVDVPVTLKMRLGWDDQLRNAPELARAAVDAGVRMVTVHGRTRCQFYKGRADWAAIADVVTAIDRPVVANGDIIDCETAVAARAASGADAVMVGRGAEGQPWVLAQIAATLAGHAPPPSPDIAARVAIMSEHYEAMLSFYGTALGVRVARKHLGWYLDRMDGTGPLRAEIMRLNSPDAVLRAIGRVPDLAVTVDSAA